MEEGACGLVYLVSITAPERRDREQRTRYAHVSYYFFGGLLGLVVASDLVLLEAGIALADDSLDLGELARLLLYSHGGREMCVV